MEEFKLDLKYNFISTEPKAVALEKIILLRQTEKFISNLHHEQKIVGPCHLGIGQEAISVAISEFITANTDSVFASHRSHNPYLAMTMDVFGLLAELARKPFGCSGGRGGSTYLSNAEKGFICSTSILTGGIGLATGAALAKKLEKKNGVAVVFFGDGAAEEGIFHEALNFSSVFSIPVFFVCENNMYSCNVDLKKRQPKRDIRTLAEAHGIISKKVDGNDFFKLHDAVKGLLNICRNEKRPVFLEANTFRISSHTGTDGKRDIGVPRNIIEIEKWRLRDPIINYLHSSEVDPNKVNTDMCAAIEMHIAKYLHNLWQKIEQTPLPQIEKNHVDIVYSESSSFPATISNKKLSAAKAPKTYLQAWQEGIKAVLSSDSRIYLFGQGLSSPWDSGKWVTDIYESMENSQIFESPNSESVTTAAAIGMAMSGVRCIVNHPRIDFLILAADPIVNQAAKAFYMSGGSLKVPLVVRAQLYRGNCQGAQHSQSLQSWFSHIPGLRVVMPSTPSDVKNLLYSSVFSDDPVLFIDDKWLHDWILPDECHEISELKNEGPKILVEGQHITIVGMGYTTRLCYEVAQELLKKDVQCEVIDLRILNPINCEIIINSCNKTKSLLVVDMSWQQCSISSEIIAQISESFSDSHIKPKIKRINIPNHPAPASTQGENKFYIDSEKIKLTVLDMVFE